MHGSVGAEPHTQHLDLQILDHYFGNVCELDLVFGFHKVYCLLDEFIIGGEVQETSKKVWAARMAAGWGWAGISRAGDTHHGAGTS